MIESREDSENSRVLRAMELSREVLLERSDLSVDLENLMEGSDDCRGLERERRRRASERARGDEREKGGTHLKVVDLSENVAEEVLLLRSSSKKTFVGSRSRELSVDRR